MRKEYHFLNTGLENAWAKGTYDPVGFPKTKLGRSITELHRFYLENDPDGSGDDQMNPEVLEYWRSQGVRKELFDEARTEEQMRFSILSPMEQTEGERFPLVYCLHGGGENNFGAEFYGFGHLTGMGQCITVCPSASGHGNPRVEREFLRILDFLKEKEYPVDYERVYVFGFSGGEGATQRLAMLHPDKIACIAPTPGPNSFRGPSYAELQSHYVENFDLMMPIVCIGGTEDGGDYWPLNTEECASAFNFYMEHVAKIRDYKPLTQKEMLELTETTDDAVKRKLGLDLHETWGGPFEDSYILLGDYKNINGDNIARFGQILGMPHIQAPKQIDLIWSFMVQFRRNLETGELIYRKTPVGGANR